MLSCFQLFISYRCSVTEAILSSMGCPSSDPCGCWIHLTNKDWKWPTNFVSATNCLLPPSWRRAGASAKSTCLKECGKMASTAVCGRVDVGSTITKPGWIKSPTFYECQMVPDCNKRNTTLLNNGVAKFVSF